MTGLADPSASPPRLPDSGFPTLPPLAPQSPARWRRYLGVLLMRISGWRIAGNIPNVPKYVLIVAPHTSNWDFFHGFCAFLVLRLDNTWLAKHTVFFWPLGILARRFGGMPIDRAKGGNVVRTCVAEFARRETHVHHHHARRHPRQGEGMEARLLLHRDRSGRSRSFPWRSNYSNEAA